MRLISARWVIPIVGPPIAEGAVVLADQVDQADQADQSTIDATGGSALDATSSTVLAIGTRADLRRDYPGASETRAEGALCPGLVNAHAHLELSALAGCVPGGDGVINWTRRLATCLAEQDPGAVVSAALDAARAAIDAKAFGTAAIGDVGNGTAGWRALGRAGLRGVFFHELVGSREARTGDALGDATKERATVPESERPKGVNVVPAPHAPYSVGPDLMRRIFAAASAAGRATTIHLAEDIDEIQLLRDGGGAWPAVLRKMGVAPEERAPGLGPTAYLERLGAFAAPPSPLLVHMVHADGDDRRRARATGATVVLCPRSNLHIGGRLPDVPALIADGVRLAIGTDSLASVPNLSPWAEIATLAARFPDVPARTWLAATTTAGASALGLALLGSLAPGNRPGLLDVELEMDFSDGGDPERALVTNPNPRVRWMASA